MIEISLIVLCIIINAILSAFEMAVVTVKRSVLYQFEKEGSVRASKFIQLRQTLERTLSTIQVGISVVAILSGSLGGLLASEYLSPALQNLGAFSAQWSEGAAVFFVVAMLTYLTVVFGELVPKSLAVKYPVRTGFAFYWFVIVLQQAFRPVVWCFERSTKVLVQLLIWIMGKPRAHRDVRDLEVSGLEKLSRQHRRYIYRLIELPSISLRDIMLDWPATIKAQATLSNEEINQLLIKCAHTRVPVCQDEKVVGLINAKELFAYLQRGGDDWRSLIRPIIKMPESVSPLNALRQMQSKRSHMSIVESDDGEVVGMVTIEDILEEVVGEIYDEDDVLPKDVGVP